MKTIRIFNELDDYRACIGGPCEQGHKLCPSPEACRLPEPPDVSAGIAVGAVALVIGLALVAALLPIQ